jgi:hypothetical protein
LYADWGRVRAAPAYGLRLTLMSRTLPGWLPWPVRQDFMWRDLDPHGWLPYPHPEVGADVRAKGVARARAEYVHSLNTFRVSPVPDRALRDLIEECGAGGIAVGLYLMPEGGEFRGWYPCSTRRQIDDYLAGLRAEYGVPVFDATDWIDEADFSDSHHLLPRGAKAFSKRLGAECLRPWLEEVAAKQ